MEADKTQKLLKEKLKEKGLKDVYKRQARDISMRA